MEDSNDTIGNRTRDLPACSAVCSSFTLHKLNALTPKTNSSMLFSDICAVRCENYTEHKHAVWTKSKVTEF